MDTQVTPSISQDQIDTMLDHLPPSMTGLELAAMLATISVHYMKHTGHAATILDYAAGMLEENAEVLAALESHRIN